MEEDKKKKKIFDRVVMGAIIGGAIGSVLGASFAPKKGKDTRQDIVDTAKKAKATSVKLIDKIKNFFKRKKALQIPQEQINSQQQQLKNPVKEEDVKKIPTEVE